VSGFFCPVYGFDGLFGPPWKGDSPSDEICPCCGIQFGLDDWHEGDADDRSPVYLAWRLKWIASGKKWWSKGPRQPPLNWAPDEQLRRVDGGYSGGDASS
jgi:hypothetical protein